MKTYKKIFGGTNNCSGKVSEKNDWAKVISKKRPLCGGDIRVKPEW